MQFSEVIEDKVLEDPDKYKDIVGREGDDKNKNPEGFQNIDAAGEETNNEIDPKKVEEDIQVLSGRENNDIFDGDEELSEILEGNLDSSFSDAQKESIQIALAYLNGSYSTGLHQDSNQSEDSKKNVEILNNMA